MVVKAETDAAGDLVLGAGVAQETGEPPGEHRGGAGTLALVELESEEFFKADIASPTHLGLVELESESKSGTTAVVQTATAAAEDPVLVAGVDKETDEPPGEPPDGTLDLALVELETEKFSRRTSTAHRIWG